jgi:hypothetical protein
MHQSMSNFPQGCRYVRINGLPVCSPVPIVYSKKQLYNPEAVDYPSLLVPAVDTDMSSLMSGIRLYMRGNKLSYSKAGISEISIYKYVV